MRYRTHVASLPPWQAYLKARQPPLLILWGTYDPSFVQPGAWAYQRDVPSAQVHLLEAGHFAMDTETLQVADLTLAFLDRQHERSAQD